MERIGMRIVCLCLGLIAWAGAAEPRQLWLVLGAPGEEMFAKDFAQQAERWRAGAERAGDSEVLEIGDRSAFERAIHSGEANRSPELWIVLIGHGTFDGRTAKFNLEGPDVSAPNSPDGSKRGRRRSS